MAWNGLTSVSESPDGGDANDIYADDIKYLVLRGVENFGGTIEAYTYPPEFEECDGSATLLAGVNIGQQPRKTLDSAMSPPSATTLSWILMAIRFI